MNTRPFIHKFTSALLFSLLLAVRLSGAVVEAPAPGSTDGNSLFRPFNTDQAGRFQQVYDASLFSSLPSSGGSIVSIDFRVDPFLGQSFGAGITNLQINLSTTTRGPDGLSHIFDENTGSDDTIVIGPKFVGIGGAGGGGFSSYTVSFILAQPFHYDPASGNLLLDFRIYSWAGMQPGRIATLDAFDVAGDGVSSVFAFGNSLPVLGQASSLGLATLFPIAVVPEPSTLVLGATALGLALWSWHRRRTKGKQT